uniref:Uncharacterized protein n=1 Tax=Grammatophora oceanica TaxID=210454 RepID=A0A7S1V9D0_9STRA
MPHRLTHFTIILAGSLDRRCWKVVFLADRGHQFTIIGAVRCAEAQLGRARCWIKASKLSACLRGREALNVTTQLLDFIRVFLNTILEAVKALLVSVIVIRSIRRSGGPDKRLDIVDQVHRGHIRW